MDKVHQTFSLKFHKKKDADIIAVLNLNGPQRYIRKLIIDDLSK